MSPTRGDTTATVNQGSESIFMSLLHQLDDGQKHEITEEDYDHFLEVLPPAVFRFTWNGERWGFGFAEGYDRVYAFKKDGDKFYAQRTDRINPSECGIPFHEQPEGFADRLDAAKELARGRNWIPTWLKIGRKNAWIREANDPPFDTQSFHGCLSDDELLDKFEHGNWSLGQAFYRGSLCFVQQVDGGDEWLTIKEDTPFESISFGHILKKEGRDAARALLARLREASVEKCRALDY